MAAKLYVRRYYGNVLGLLWRAHFERDVSILASVQRHSLIKGLQFKRFLEDLPKL